MPFVGSWTPTDLKQFARSARTSADGIELCWIEKGHAWSQHWTLPTKSRDALHEVGALFFSLPDSEDDKRGLFHPDYRSADPRWPHLKLYHFSDRRSNRLLVTSANFSTSAWGCADFKRGTLRIENFEIGVIVDSIPWPLADVRRCYELRKLSVCSPPADPRSESGLWADASWNGRVISLAWRVATGRVERISVEVHGKARKRPLSTRGLAKAGQHRFPWRLEAGVPAWIHLTSSHHTIRVPVFDARTHRERTGSLVPDMDDETFKMLRDQILLERYDGPVAGNGTEHKESELRVGGSSAADYGVDALVFAREQFRIVDSWADKLGKAKDEDARQALERDGEKLVEAFSRRATALSKDSLTCARAIGPRAAAEELRRRLRDT